MIKLSDYVAKRLTEFGVRHVFMITGGGAMHLNDSLGRAFAYICNHHEQASAMGAEGYARIAGVPGVLNVTTGPGGVNALNGVYGAWTDSIPMLVLSGQVKRETCMATYPGLRVRQLGYQEVDIIRMAQGIAKYAVLVSDPLTIRYHLERAWYLTTAGRPGPCWLDIPIDVQGARIDEDALPAYDPAEDRLEWDSATVQRHCAEVLDRISKAKRPVILAGGGIRIANADDLLETIAHKLGVPVTTSRTAQDTVASDEPLYCGRPGVDNGDRPGNFAVQNADLLLSLGCRMGIMQVGYAFSTFAREAYKISVDIDAAELAKPTVEPDLGIHCDVKVFLEHLSVEMEQRGYNPEKHADWLAWCKQRVQEYPTVLPRHREFNGWINPYHFIDELIGRLTEDDIVVCGNGSAFIMASQVARIKKGMRFFFNSGCASMGYDLPAAVGAAVARPGKRIICLAGDGSIQMNIQELQTIKHHQLPIKIFVLNNDGYLSMRITQRNFFDRFVGEGPRSGVSFPDYVNVGVAYGLPSTRIDIPDFGKSLDDILAAPGPALCDVVVDPEQRFEPKAASRQLPSGAMVSAPLEDLWPFLDRDELRRNMIIEPLADSLP
jgi:acetolactate synthase-1/2/3 large subunit